MGIAQRSVCESSKLEMRVRFPLPTQIISGRDGSQSCLISKAPCVRLTPPRLKHQDMEKIIQSLISPTLAAIMEKLHNENVVREDIVNIFCNNEGKYVAVYYK